MNSKLKMRSAMLSGALLGVVAALAGCSGGSGPVLNPVAPGTRGSGPGLTDAPNLSRAACSATGHTAGRAKWTVLIYVNAANNLQPDSLLNVGQMAAVGSDADMNIVLQWKQANCNDCFVPGAPPPFAATRRYLIKQHSAADVSAIKNGNTSVLDPDRIADPTTNDSTTHQSDMGSFLTLQNFVRFGSLTYPADNLMVVVWDHGSGWRNVFRSASTNKLASRFRAVSQDNESNNEIETWELPTALSGTTQPIDALVFDCSLEMMAEVAYEVRANARVMVGSEESPPGAGYPYDAFLTALKSSIVDPCAAGNNILTTFIQAYPSASDITQSVVDLSKMATVASALDTFGSTLLTHASDQSTIIANARGNAQSYAYPDNKDLYDFADLIRITTTTSDLQTAAFNLQSALRGKDTAVLFSSHGSTSQDFSYGMAIYEPDPGNFLTTYSNLALTRAAPHWSQFLQAQQK